MILITNYSYSTYNETVVTIFIHVFTLDGHVLDTDVNWLFPTENVSFLPAGKPQKAINVIFSLLFSNNSLGCNRCKL